jgi:hypothetical protein
MDENNCEDDDLDKNSSGSDSEVLNNIEKELDMMSKPPLSENVLEKRKKPEDVSEESEDQNFVTVTRRRPKKVLIRSGSPILRSENINQKYEVCITCINPLPKQMALAKLLRSEQITGVTRIKYKSLYKIFIEFDSKWEAEKLIKNKKIMELEYKAQFRNETTFCYGLIRGVDLDITDEEIIESLSSDIHISAIRRLKRLNPVGKWVNSESVRLCFRGTAIPEYIKAYDCSIRVEKYIFPVTQCSGCWKFGHTIKFCPSKKTFCPKCSELHENCDTKTFKCPNCKGPHIALDKSCPVFQKEKKIRQLMSQHNATYKIALERYIREEKNTEERNQYTQEGHILCTPSVRDPPISRSKTYCEALLTTNLPHLSPVRTSNDSEVMLETEKQSQNNTIHQTQRQDKKRGEDTFLEYEFNCSTTKPTESNETDLPDDGFNT